MTNIESILLSLSLFVFLPSLILFFKRRFGEKYSHKWRKKSAEKVLAKIQTFDEKQTFAYLRKIDPFTMEELILSALDKREDIEIKRNKRYTGDGGIDGKFYLLRQNNGKEERLKCIIQAKRYKSLINPKHLKEFANQIEGEKAHLGLFVHTGRTSDNSFAFARGVDNLEIISGNKLIKLLRSGVFH